MTPDPDPIWGLDAPASALDRVRLIGRREVGRWDRGRVLREARAAATILLLLVLTGRGVVAFLAPAPKPTTIVQGETRNLAAERLAVAAARAAFTYDAAHPADYAAGVSQVAPGWVTFGWDGKGSSRVTAATLVGYVTGPSWTWYQVAVDTDTGTWTVLVPVTRTATGLPAMAGVPSIGSSIQTGAPVTPVAPPAGADETTIAAVRPIVDGYLRAWATGAADLGAYAAEGWTPPPPPGALRPAGPARITITGEGSARVARVVVRWLTSDGRAMPAAYQLGLVSSGTRWTINDMTPAAIGPTEIPT